MGEQSFCLQLALFQPAGNICSRKDEGTHLKEAEGDGRCEGSSGTCLALDPHCVSSWPAAACLWRHENASLNQAGLDLNFALSLSPPRANYITSLSLSFLGVWEEVDREPIKNTNLLSHCEARCWETNSNQSHPFTLETLDLTLKEEGSGHQHGKIERCRHGRSVSSGEPNWTEE